MKLDHQQRNLYNIGVSYKKADAHTRGRYSLSKENQIELLKEAKEIGFEGIFILSTCNRTEITGFAEHPYQLIQLLCKYSDGNVEEFARISNVYKGNEAINQLFRIGTGLESQILGDYEIVGQLKLAFKLAKKYLTINAHLERLVNLVLQASKKVKNTTQLSSGTTSVSYAAVQYIIQNIPSYNSKNILVFGLGKMGKHTCMNLAEYTKNKAVCLINRTEEKAISFVKEHTSIRNSSIENLTEEIANSDILIVSTGSDTPTVTKEHLSTDRKILILDLSMPENVDTSVSEYENVSLVNVDELSKITLETLSTRQKEVPIAEEIIEVYKEEFNDWLNNRKLVPAINALINFQKKKIKNFDETQAEILTNRFIQKITTQFVKHLKEEETSVNDSIQIMSKVFGKS
jgi:glutamyl-tRNA reductase